MKKTLKIVGIAMLSMAMFFVSCKQESKIITVENPEIQVKAYPGYNYLVWTPVVDGSVNVIQRNDGKTIDTKEKEDGSYTYTYTNIYNCKDYDIEDGVEYTYTFYTSNLNSQSQNISEYENVGNKTSVTVKAIKPAYFNAEGKQTTALDLVNYEENANKDYVVNAENIKVYTDSKNEYIYVQVPQKEYLDYEVKLYKGNAVTLALPDTVKGNGIQISSRLAVKNTDKFVTYFAKKITAGEYSVKVTVKSNDLKYAPNEIIAKNKVTIKEVEVDEYNPTRDVKAVFTDTTNTKVRVMWKPAKDRENNLYPTTKYTVYAFKDSTQIYEKVTEEIKASKKDGEDIYYVETEKRNEKYIVVLSDNGKYEDIDITNITTDKIVWYVNPTAGVVDGNVTGMFFNNSEGKDSYSDDFKITVSGLNKDDTRKVSVKYFTFDPKKVDYTSYNVNNFSENFVDADYVKEGTVKIDAETNNAICIISDVTKGHKVAYQVTVSGEGLKDAVKGFISTYVSE